MNDLLARLREQFETQYEVIDNDCWQWLGRTSDGYGHFNVLGGFMLAHRFSYEFLVGSIPEGLVLDHLCRNRACVNPAHLEPVTYQTNILRGNGLAAQNAAKTHCPSGHPYDEVNTLRLNGRRHCRACSAAKGRRQRAAEKIGA